MAKLSEIALGTIAGMAPTPVEQYAINTYFVNDQLFNMMEFVPIGMGTGIGNIAASYVQYSEEVGVDAAFRRIGEEYVESNATPEPKTVYLKNLGGSYNVDRTTTRALVNGGMDVWKEQQAAQKANLIKNAFAKNFIRGAALETDNKGFNGIYYEIDRGSASQEVKAPFDLSTGLTIENAVGLEMHFNEAIALMNVEPNAVITTRKGSALAKTLNAHRHMSTEVVEIGSVRYNQLMGIPIIAVDESYFPEDKVSIGVPFIFLYISDDGKGIKAAIPADGNVLDIVDPELGDGTLVKTGAMELITTPVFSNPKSMAVCYVDMTPVVTP